MDYEAGTLRERVEVLELTARADGWAWTVARKTWAGVEVTDKTNLFSKVGIGARDAGLVLRRQSLDLSHALRWRGQHLFLTALTETRRGWLDGKAALVAVETCQGAHYEERPDPERGNRPKREEVWRKEFPGVLTEKYVRYEREESHAKQAVTLVLVTPKPVELAVGELVTVRGGVWNVTAVHTLDPWKNEYEIEWSKAV